MSPIVNVAGSEFDFDRVTFAVLEECEHRRRAMPLNGAKDGLMDVARRKLDEIHKSYVDARGSSSYWQRLENEILTTVMPQYIPAAIDQNRREKYDQEWWGGGNILGRLFMLAIGLGLAWLTLRLPFVPAIETVLAIVFAVSGWFYPEIRRWRNESRHSRLLNRLVESGAAYQRNSKIHYLSEGDLEEVFSPLEDEEAKRRAGAAAAAQTNRTSG